MRSIRFSRYGERRGASPFVLALALALLVWMAVASPLAARAWASVAGAGDDERNSAATADEIDPEARRLFARGLARFEAGHYDEAIADFTASYHIAPLPGLLYNLAQAHRLNGDCAHALAAYRQFLATDPPAKIRQKAQARIAEIEPQCPPPPPPPSPSPSPERPPTTFIPAPAASLPAAAAPVSTPVAPPPARSPAAAPTPVAVSPAASSPVASSPVASRAALPLQPISPPSSKAITITAPAQSAPRPEVSARARRRWGGAGLGVGALACSVSSFYFAGQARDAASDVSAAMHLARPWDADIMQRQQTGLRDEKVAWAFGAGAVIAAALSLWLILNRGGGT